MELDAKNTKVLTVMSSEADSFDKSLRKMMDDLAEANARIVYINHSVAYDVIRKSPIYSAIVFYQIVEDTEEESNDDNIIDLNESDSTSDSDSTIESDIPSNTDSQDNIVVVDSGEILP